MDEMRMSRRHLLALGAAAPFSVVLGRMAATVRDAG
jgi:hypothetical protein